MATFPSYMFLLKDGFGVRRNSAAVRTEFEDGFAKQAKRWSKVLVERKVVYGTRTKADYQSFITWFNSTINRGADWFSWTDPVDGVTKQARIKGGVIDSESPVDPMLTRWDLSFTLEVWDA